MHTILETIVRQSYARLLAYIALRNGHNIAAAEDALADAFASALTCWAKDGVPEKPEAWLLKAARNRLIDEGRRSQVAARAQVQVAKPAFVDSSMDTDSIPDERLQLMFACAHPAIDAKVRTPLLLQVVLGLSAESIAAAFLIPAKTMSQRLVRAKTKIRDAGITFGIPDKPSLASRSRTVLDAIYAVYGNAWEGHAPAQRDMVEEAIRLARILVELMPSESEALGLLSLLLFCHARRDSRRTSCGRFIPLDEQDARLWFDDEIEEAESLLRSAAKSAQLGRYQLEAAIQSAHMQRRHGTAVPWSAIVDMYRLLVDLSPNIGATVSQAAAMLKVGMAEQALDELDRLESNSVHSYQAYWVVRAHVLHQLQSSGVTSAFNRAIGLCSDEATRDFLITERSRLPERNHIEVD